MKTRKSILLGAFAALLFIGTTVFLTQSPRSVESALNSADAAEHAARLPAEEVVPRSSPHPDKSGLVDSIRSTPVTLKKTVVNLPESPAELPSIFRVPAELVLAEVNGKPIQLKDLVPLEAQETEKTMTPEEYESRLNRAIEMELTFQGAAAEGVGLTPEQSKRLHSIAQKHEATFQQYRKQGITWSSFTYAQLEFEQRLTAALMLQENLVGREAGVVLDSDAGVQAQHEQLRNEPLNRFKASSKISISAIGG